MSDSFDRTSSKAIENVVLGAGAALGTVLAGPGGGIAATVVIATCYDWMRAQADQHNLDLFHARFAAVEREARALDDRVAKLENDLADEGKQPDRTDHLSREAIYSEFARAVTEAKTAEKRYALVVAAAKQFDPRLGSPETRQYWFERVRELTDIEIRAVNVVGERGRVAFADGILAPAPGGTRYERVPGFTDAEWVALSAAVDQLDARAYVARTSTTLRVEDSRFPKPTFTLSEAGRVIRLFLSEDA